MTFTEQLEMLCQHLSVYLGSQETEIKTLNQQKQAEIVEQQRIANEEEPAPEQKKNMFGPIKSVRASK